MSTPKKGESQTDEIQPLPKKWQICGFVVAVSLIIMLSGAVWVLMYFAKRPPECNTYPEIFNVLLLVITSGFIGGAGRSMYKLITQVNEKGKDPILYLQRWFLYLLKPFMGSVGGLFFFFCVYLGMISLLPVKEIELYDFRRVCLTGILGGIFFEHVFALLEKFMPQEKDTTKPNHKSSTFKE